MSAAREPIVVPVVAARRGLPALSRPRQAPSRGALARRQAAMRFLRFLLPATGIALLTLLLLWPELEGGEGRLSFRTNQAGITATAHVRAPLYQGVDEERRPYTLTAGIARQLEGRGRPGAEVVALEAPRADITLGDGAWVLLEAREGEYDRGRNLLQLEGGVTLWHDGGTRFVSEAATIDLMAGTARGQRPVQATGPFGVITGEGFEMTDRGAALVFTGRARAVLEGGGQ
jgi:lipopolysaccharide export system protein LptC